MAIVQTIVTTRIVPCLRKKKVGTMSNYIYIHIVATTIVASACPSLLMHSSDGRVDVTMLIATDNAHRY
jgi:tellurite resistance protein TehA-like permease